MDALPKTISGKIRRSELRERAVTALPPFEIERFFAVHEFAVPYLLCASDVEPLPMHELLGTRTTRCASTWDSLVLGYTETLGSPVLRRRSPGSTRRSRPTT